jgi:hypothetical protein
MLKPLANLAGGVARLHSTRYDHRYSLVGVLVILAIAIGTFSVLLVDWLDTLPNPFAR